jgi:hypothetical protein
MAVLSDRSGRLLGQEFFSELGVDDLAPAYEVTLARGWKVVDGAVVLAGWYESYHGDRASFPTVMDYEIAVNGRAVPDMDLLEEGDARVVRLLRRGAAFAWAALHAQHRQFPEMSMAGFVSAAPTLFDPGFFTGNVTFCCLRPGEPSSADPAGNEMDYMVSLVTDDCMIPLS